MASTSPSARSVLLPAAIVIAVLVVVVATLWALRNPDVPTLTAASATAQPLAAESNGPGLDPAHWQVTLWQPLRDPPPPPPPVKQKPPMTASLIAIAERDGKPVAVIEVEAGGALHYLAEGGRAGDYTVQSIDATAVVVRHHDEDVRLELPQ